MEKQEKRQNQHIALAGAKEKEEEEEGKSWRLCIFGSRVPLTA